MGNIAIDKWRSYEIHSYMRRRELRGPLHPKVSSVWGRAHVTYSYSKTLIANSNTTIKGTATQHWNTTGLCPSRSIQTVSQPHRPWQPVQTTQLLWSTASAIRASVMTQRGATTPSFVRTAIAAWTAPAALGEWPLSCVLHSFSFKIHSSLHFCIHLKPLRWSSKRSKLNDSTFTCPSRQTSVHVRLIISSIFSLTLYIAFPSSLALLC